MMSKMMIPLLVFINIFLCSTTLQYYISPAHVRNGTCTVNSQVALTPCYNIHQLCDIAQLISNKSSVSLLLLPGRHVIENRTFSTSNISRLEISPWNEEKLVVIQCLLQSSFTFESIRNLLISSIKFTFCSIQHKKTRYYASIGEILLMRNCIFSTQQSGECHQYSIKRR